MKNTSKQTVTEIDLFELFSILWKKKLTIILITCLFIAFFAIYAFNAKKEWVSNAQIIPPNAIQLGGFLEAQRGYFRLTRGADEKIYDYNEKIKDSIRNAYDTLIVMLSSEANKRDYFQKTEYINSQVNKSKDDFLTQKMLLDIAINNLEIKETINNSRDSFNITFAAEKAIDTQKILKDYIDYTNALALNKLYNELSLKINEHILNLENEVNGIKHKAERTRKNEIMTLKQALAVAKDANLTGYIGESTLVGNTIIDFSDSNSLFLLGEKYLSAKLRVLETSPIIYPVDYYQFMENIENLKELISYEEKGILYEYTMAPSLPLITDKPNKFLILFLGVLFGMFVAIMYVIINLKLANRKY